MVDSEQTGSEGRKTSGDEPNTPLSDSSLLDMLDSLIERRGRVGAAAVLGVNYRTLMACYESRSVSPRMRSALEEYRDDHMGDVAGLVDGDDSEEESEGLEQRMVALEEECRALREIVESQGQRLEALEQRVDALEERLPQLGEADAAGGDNGQRQEWRPPGRGHGLPDAGVVTLEQQPDEEEAFGPAAALVAEWRKLRTGGEAGSGRVERARTSVRRWELEIAMIGDFHLTLPPETEPLDASRRKDHLRWRRETLAAARRDLSKANRMRWLRRALTVGLWRR